MEGLRSNKSGQWSVTNGRGGRGAVLIGMGKTVSGCVGNVERMGEWSFFLRESLGYDQRTKFIFNIKKYRILYGQFMTDFRIVLLTLSNKTKFV